MLFILLAAGCQSAETRSYDITVLNRLHEPITVFLTKTGPPDERGWLSPEQLASLPISEDTARAGTVIGPRNVAHIGNARGVFGADTFAVLRVYRRVGTLEDYSALSPGNPKRLDVYLHPGVNHLLIYGDNDELIAQHDP